MFKFKDRSAPTVLRELFTENKSVHDYNMRHCENFRVAQANWNNMHRSISCKPYPHGIM